jgi:hypothetical protein
MGARSVVFASLAAALLAGCVASTRESVQGTASLSPSQVNPGQPVTVTYSLDRRAGAPEIAAVELVGLPPNAVAEAAPSAATQSIGVRLAVPTRAGSYPLQLKLVTARGEASLLPVGTLTVNRMPAHLSEVTLSPAAHSAGACSGSTQRVSLSYTVESPNGAAAVSEIRLLPTELAAAIPMLPRTPLVLRNPTVLAPPPEAKQAQGFAVRPLAAVAAAPRQVASAAAGAPPGASDAALLPPSPRWDAARDRLTTELEIPCALPAPTVWRFPIVGVVAGAQPTNSVAAQYRVDP